MSLAHQHDRTKLPDENERRAVSMAGGGKDLSHWLGASRVTRIRAALAAGGIEMTGPHVGRIITNEFHADVLLEADETIHVRCAAQVAGAPRTLLERAAGAPGSVRFAASTSGLHLVADTRLNGVAHLPDSLQDIRRGFLHLWEAGTRLTVPDTDKKHITAMTDALSAAIQEAGWPKEDAIETPYGYSLHTALEGSRMSVEVAVGPDSVIVRRNLLTDFPEGASGCAVGHHALACNARLRGCRLAILAGRLQVETTLSAPIVDGDWLAYAVRAVAGAARCILPALEMLAREPAVAEAYVTMFPAAAEKQLAMDV